MDSSSRDRKKLRQLQSEQSRMMEAATRPTVDPDAPLGTLGHRKPMRVVTSGPGTNAGGDSAVGSALLLTPTKPRGERGGEAASPQASSPQEDEGSSAVILPTSPDTTHGKGGAALREKSLMSQRFEGVKVSGTFKERGSRATAGKEETALVPSSAVVVEHKQQYHTSQHGPLNAELRGQWETLTAKWSNEVGALVAQIDNLSTNCSTMQASSHHAARHYEENFELPIESVALTEQEVLENQPRQSTVERFVAEVKQKEKQQRQVRKQEAKRQELGSAASTASSVATVRSDDQEIAVGEDAAGGSDDEEEDKPPNVLRLEKIGKQAGLRLPPSVVTEILNSPFIELQVVAATMHELRTTENKIPSVRLEQRLEDLIAVDAAARQPVAGVLLAMHEKQHFDVFGPTKNSLDRGLPEVTRLMHNADLLREDRSTFLAQGNIKPLEELLEGEVQIRRQLVNLLCSRMDQLVDCDSVGQEYSVGRKRLIELAHRISTDFTRGSNTFTEDLNFDIDALGQHRKALRQESDDRADAHLANQQGHHEKIHELELQEHSAWGEVVRAMQNVKRLVAERHSEMGQAMCAEEKYAVYKKEAQQTDSVIDAHTRLLLEARGCISRTSAAAEKVAETEQTMARNLNLRDINEELLTLTRAEAKRFRASYREFATCSESLREQRQSKLESLKRGVRQLHFDFEIAVESLDPKAGKYPGQIQQGKENQAEAEGLLVDTEDAIAECRELSAHVLDFMCDLQRKAGDVKEVKKLAHKKQKKLERRRLVEDEKRKGEGVLAIEEKKNVENKEDDAESKPPNAVAAIDDDTVSTATDDISSSDDDEATDPPDTPVNDPLLIERASKIQQQQAKNKAVTKFFLSEGEKAEGVFTEIRHQRNVAAQQQKEDQLHQEGLDLQRTQQRGDAQQQQQQQQHQAIEGKTDEK